jgi:hypothetical protein
LWFVRLLAPIVDERLGGGAREALDPLAGSPSSARTTPPVDVVMDGRSVMRSLGKSEIQLLDRD